jgi:bacterioferritin-associated ferredoxin
MRNLLDQLSVLSKIITLVIGLAIGIIISSCDDGHQSNGPANVVNLDNIYKDAPTAIYNGHKMYVIEPEYRCASDCPKCEANMKRIITEVIDSINHSKQY